MNNNVIVKFSLFIYAKNLFIMYLVSLVGPFLLYKENPPLVK